MRCFQIMKRMRRVEVVEMGTVGTKAEMLKMETRKARMARMVGVEEVVEGKKRMENAKSLSPTTTATWASMLPNSRQRNERLVYRSGPFLLSKEGEKNKQTLKEVFGKRIVCVRACVH
jgi:hypothetical protein